MEVEDFCWITDGDIVRPLVVDCTSFLIKGDDAADEDAVIAHGLGCCCADVGDLLAGKDNDGGGGRT